MINFRISAEDANMLLIALKDSQKIRESQGTRAEALGDLSRRLYEAIGA